MNLSYWETEVFFKNIQAIVIGSGIVGLNAAITLKEKHPDWRVAIFEKGPIPSGASTRNAGFACFGSITELLADLKERTEDQVFSLVEDRWQGLALMRQKLGDENIEFQQLGGYELFAQNDKESYEESRDRIESINQAIHSITGFKDTFVPVDEKIREFGFGKIDHLILNKAEGQIHTGKMMANLLELAREKGVEIFNGLGLKQLEDQGNQVLLELENGWEISALKVVIATNGFAKQLFPELQSRPARNQVMITEPISNLSLKGTFHYQEGYWYFRNEGNRVLLGGGRHLDLTGEETSEFGFTERIQKEQTRLLKEIILPGIKWEIAQKWSGIMGVGDHKKPIIKQISPNVVASVRLGGMGVAIGTWVGQQGAELIMDT